MFAAFLVILFTVVISIMLKYDVEGEKELPFSISKILIISTVDGSLNEDAENIWNIGITQVNDIYMYIDKTMDTKATIEEYKKLKHSVITEAVTKGIRGERPMKDSGIDWIGEIPVLWEICRVRNIGMTQNGISKGGEFFGEGEPFITYSDVYKNMVLPKIATGLILSTKEEQDKFSVKKGDVFFTRTSETIEEIGISSTCEETINNAVFAGFLIRLRLFSEKLLSCFAKYYFRSNIHRTYFVREMNIVTRASLSQDLLKSLIVLLPPIPEQQVIADFLDKKCSEIEQLIAIKQQKIESLKEYKKSLIYEYVTGKKEVI